MAERTKVVLAYKRRRVERTRLMHLRVALDEHVGRLLAEVKESRRTHQLIRDLSDRSVAPQDRWQAVYANSGLIQSSAGSGIASESEIPAHPDACIPDCDPMFRYSWTFIGDGRTRFFCKQCGKADLLAVERPQATPELPALVGPGPMLSDEEVRAQLIAGAQRLRASTEELLQWIAWMERVSRPAPAVDTRIPEAEPLCELQLSELEKQVLAADARIETESVVRASSDIKIRTALSGLLSVDAPLEPASSSRFSSPEGPVNSADGPSQPEKSEGRAMAGTAHDALEEEYARAAAENEQARLLNAIQAAWFAYLASRQYDNPGTFTRVAVRDAEAIARTFAAAPPASLL